MKMKMPTAGFVWLARFRRSREIATRCAGKRRGVPNAAAVVARPPTARRRCSWPGRATPSRSAPSVARSCRPAGRGRRTTTRRRPTRWSSAVGRGRGRRRVRRRGATRVPRDGVASLSADRACCRDAEVGRRSAGTCATRVPTPAAPATASPARTQTETRCYSRLPAAHWNLKL